MLLYWKRWLFRLVVLLGVFSVYPLGAYVVSGTRVLPLDPMNAPPDDMATYLMWWIAVSGMLSFVAMMWVSSRSSGNPLRPRIGADHWMRVWHVEGIGGSPEGRGADSNVAPDREAGPYRAKAAETASDQRPPRVVVSGRGLLTYRPHLRCVGPRGRLLWNHAFGRPVLNPQPEDSPLMARVDSTLILPSFGGSTLRAVHCVTGQQLWKRRLAAPLTHVGALSDSVMVTMKGDQWVELDAGDGNVRQSGGLSLFASSDDSPPKGSTVAWPSVVPEPESSELRQRADQQGAVEVFSLPLVGGVRAVAVTRRLRDRDLATVDIAFEDPSVSIGLRTVPVGAGSAKAGTAYVLDGYLVVHWSLSYAGDHSALSRAELLGLRDPPDFRSRTQHIATGSYEHQRNSALIFEAETRQLVACISPESSWFQDPSGRVHPLGLV